MAKKRLSDIEKIEESICSVNEAIDLLNSIRNRDSQSEINLVILKLDDLTDDLMEIRDYLE